jgi:hypothetical protein
MSSSQPIFVTGPDRSGTSLMFAILGSHPNISMVRRTNIWRWFYGQFGDLKRQENFEQCLEMMLRYTRMEGLHPEPDRIRQEFWQDTPSYGRLFDLIHRHHAESLGKSRWGDKSLHTEHYAHQVFTEFPHAKIIHMIRDPRDRYASIIKRYEGRTKGVASTTMQWLTSANLATQNARKYPNNYLVVRYESLAQSPEETVRNTCKFLDEEYRPSMLMMDGIPEHRDGGNSSFERLTPGTISTSSVGRYQKVLTPREIAFIQAQAGKKMTAYGYSLAPINFAASERVAFFLTDFPLNSIKMAAAGIKDAFGEPQGQKVPKHRLRQPEAGQATDNKNLVAMGSAEKR